MDIKEVTPKENDYLARLSVLEKPPERLYYYGDLPKCSGEMRPNPRFPSELVGRPKTVAIVGARKMTAYGETVAFRFAKELAALGVIIVSGMAVGIDAAAHRGALAAGGRTIAFLGTPINNIYPAENEKLFCGILENGGAVLSEIPADGKYYPKTSFLERNRLIAGVADAVVIVEADLRSGSLNTAAHALEQGVPLFAVPGDVTRQMSRGCNGLFNKGASAAVSVEDILNAILPGSIRLQRKQKIELFSSTPDETAVLRVLATGITEGEEIVGKIARDDQKFDFSRFNIAITMLEVRGIVKRELGNQWILA
jgi:DNA processing protein